MELSEKTANKPNARADLRRKLELEKESREKEELEKEEAITVATDLQLLLL